MTQDFRNYEFFGLVQLAGFLCVDHIIFQKKVRELWIKPIFFLIKKIFMSYLHSSNKNISNSFICCSSIPFSPILYSLWLFLKREIERKGAKRPSTYCRNEKGKEGQMIVSKEE